jgi:hypothetical protein
VLTEIFYDWFSPLQQIMNSLIFSTGSVSFPPSIASSFHGNFSETRVDGPIKHHGIDNRWM